LRFTDGEECARRFNAPDRFGSMLALGVTAMVIFQSLINFAVVLG